MVRNSKQIVVGMSGGVDSSMSLVLLKKAGWNPIGVSLRMFASQDPASFELAEKVCQKEKVNHFILDCRKDFKKKVVDYFVREYKNGRTPSPCLICNPGIKFKKLFAFAKEHHIDFVATGHYARIKEKDGVYQLLQAKDKKKDQSYFLSFLPQNQLKNIVFPLGNYSKDEVYDLARKNGYDIFEKVKQSQDVCFLAGHSISQFLKNKIDFQSGQIKNTQGNVLGEHQGLASYTLGQRKNIGLSGGPYWVGGMDKAKNVLIITKNKKDLLKKEVILYPYHFISNEKPKEELPVMAKTRYGQPLKKAVLFPAQGKKLKILFSQPVLAPTPGQFCVFYRGQVCLGGGVIE